MNYSISCLNLNSPRQLGKSSTATFPLLDDIVLVVLAVVVAVVAVIYLSSHFSFCAAAEWHFDACPGPGRGVNLAGEMQIRNVGAK